MLHNLKEVMSRDNVTIEDMSRVLGIHRNSVSKKVNGDTDFTIGEALDIWRIFFKRYDFQWLFYKDSEYVQQNAS